MIELKQILELCDNAKTVAGVFYFDGSFDANPANFQCGRTIPPSDIYHIYQINPETIKKIIRALMIARGALEGVANRKHYCDQFNDDGSYVIDDFQWAQSSLDQIEGILK